MDRQHNTDTTSKRRATATRQGIIAAGCVAGALLISASADAKMTVAPKSSVNAIHSTVLRGQLTGNRYSATKAIQPFSGSPVGNHWDVQIHTDTPHTDNGFWPFHTDNAHSDAYSHGDESVAPTTPAP